MKTKLNTSWSFVIAVMFLLFTNLPAFSTETIKVSNVTASSYLIAKQFGKDGLHPRNLLIENSRYFIKRVCSFCKFFFIL